MSTRILPSLNRCKESARMHARRLSPALPRADRRQPTGTFGERDAGVARSCTGSITAAKADSEGHCFARSGGAAVAPPSQVQAALRSSRATERRAPFETLNLQPGELVRVKSKEEIVKTLDTHNANRGMSFDGEMVRYCGREARVLRRVEQIIDEKSGRMLHLKTPCVVLESVTCTGRYHRQCPRAIYPYWREIWLERVDEPSSPQLVLRRTPDVAAVKAARTGSHFGDIPTSRTSGRSNSRSTSRASARRPSRSRR